MMSIFTRPVGDAYMRPAFAILIPGNSKQKTFPGGYAYMDNIIRCGNRIMKQRPIGDVCMRPAFAIPIPGDYDEKTQKRHCSWYEKGDIT
jgi:hypothetical protein